MEKRKIGGVIAAVIVMALMIIEACISRALLSYGYSFKQLPQTTEVFFHLSKGFTVTSTVDGQTSRFIGRTNYDFDELFRDNGYKKLYELHGITYYSKDGEFADFGLSRTEYSCTWFTVYEISADHEIETFK